jgi:hypothetical protein
VSNAFIFGAVGTLILVISCSLTTFSSLDISAWVPAAELTQSRSMGETNWLLPWKAPNRKYLHDDLFILPGKEDAKSTHGQKVKTRWR